MTVIFLVMGIPHCPGVGVNVYDPDAWLLTTAGLHVPVKPLLEFDGRMGAVDPWHIGWKLLNVGVNTGLDKMIPVFKCVVHPFTTIVNSEYIPAFNPVMITCPEPFATKSAAAIGVPSSEYETEYVVAGVSPLMVTEPSLPLQVEGFVVSNDGELIEKVDL